MRKPLFLFVLFFQFCLLLFAAQLYAQEKLDTVFVDTVVPRIDITIADTVLNNIYNNPESNEEYPCTFTFNNFISPQETETNVGFRIRGNTSRGAQKKSFRISFNTFQKGREFHGLKDINLKGDHNDPSIIRSRLSFYIMDKFKVEGSRANHVELYINGNYYGLYTNIEHYNDDFAKDRFGNKNGNLYKCTYGADLTYKGTDKQNYKDSGYELQTNTELDDFSDLINFTRVLNNTSSTSFKTEIEKVFNVNSYLKALAIEVLTGHWDGYSYNMNNYYLYNNNGKFEYILYDMDNTLGIDWMDRTWNNRNIYDWARHNNPRPLTTKILEVPEFKARYTFYMRQLLEEIFSPTNLFPKIDAIHSLITPSAERDQYRTMDYGWNMDDFHNSYNQRLSASHVKEGLKPYIQTRYQTALQQLNVARPNPDLDLYVNEFMASNSKTLANDLGKHEDWIELYNAGSEPVYLGDKFLTDNLKSPEKWQMPDITLDPGKFIVFWADDSVMIGGSSGPGSLGYYHAPYKLSANGEQLGLFDGYFAPIDTFSFGAQQKDVSTGRYPDGTGPLYLMPVPTPGKSNTLAASGLEEAHAEINLLTLAPNPFTSSIKFKFNVKQDVTAVIQISDLTGRIVFSDSKSIKNQNPQWIWDGKTNSGQELPEGIYLVNTQLNSQETSQKLKPQKILLTR